MANKRRSFELLAKGVFRLHTGDDIWEISLRSLVLPANMVERAEKYLSNQREVAVLGNCIHRTYTNNKGEKVVGSEIHVSELLLLYYPWHKCNRC